MSLWKLMENSSYPNGWTSIVYRSGNVFGVPEHTPSVRYLIDLDRRLNNHAAKDDSIEYMSLEQPETVKAKPTWLTLFGSLRHLITFGHYVDQHDKYSSLVNLYSVV